MIQTLDNIDRLSSPTQRRDVERYVRAHRPFICSDLFAGSLVEGVADGDAIGELFAGSALLDTNGGPLDMTVREYFARAEVPPGSLNVKFPPALHRELTALAQRSAIGSDDLFLTAWMGRAGCLQRLHCDMDGRHNFLAQAFGDKRICLVPPAETQKLMPALDKQLLFSEVPFHRYSEAEKLTFLRFVDGRDTLLRRGEALYIPPLWWHSVDYVTDSFSVSWRPKSTPLLEELSSAWPYLWRSEWPLWQGVIAALGSSDEALERAGERARALRHVLEDGAARGAHDALRELHDELCPGRYARPFGNADLHAFEVRRERPLLPKSSPWRSDEVPRLQPYLRLVVGPGIEAAAAILVIDGARVIAEAALEPEDVELIQALLTALQRPGARATVAALADEIGCATGDVAEILSQLSAEAWVAA